MIDDDKLRESDSGGCDCIDTCPSDCKCHTCDYQETKPFVATTIEPFDRFNSKSVRADCGEHGINNIRIPRYLATNFHFEKDNMVPAGKQFVMNVLNTGALVAVAIYE